jgi:cysteine desulfurase / selenocysteine lyase
MHFKDIKKEFPIFTNHPDLVYLDSAATTQKPREVIEAERFFYENQNANVHRGIYGLAVEATNTYENTRKKVKNFLNAAHEREIIFTSGTTEGVNLVAQSYALDRVNVGDNIIISAMEHHSNLIPWQQVCLKKGAELRVIPMNTEGVLDWDVFKSFLNNNTKLVAVTHISNTLGTINPIEEIIEIAHQNGTPVFIDAAQSITTQVIDVQQLKADFVAFSGHKLFGPTGVGILYGREELLNQMSPYKYGGEMIRDVTFEKTIFAGLPQKFEAGTPNIAGVAALGTAIDFVEKLGRDNISKHIKLLLEEATEKLLGINGVKIYGTAPQKTGILSFILRGIHPHDMATILGEKNIAIRAGHHCTQPIMDFFEIPGTARASFSIYNDVEDIDILVEGIQTAIHLFKS